MTFLCIDVYILKIRKENLNFNLYKSKDKRERERPKKGEKK